jgi:hypothetical protein
MCLLTCATVSFIFGRLNFTDWAAPQWLEGDPLEVYARVKIAHEQPVDTLFNLTKVDALGAPIRADWTGYPAPDRVIFVLTGRLAGLVGLIAAIQWMSAVILGLNAVSFYLCARWLRWRWEWAAALAMVFALCTYNVRWGITLSFSQTFTLPPLILVCALAARRGVALTRGWTMLAAGLGLWLGQGNPYLAYFSGFVAGGALLLSLFRGCPWIRFAPLATFLVALSVCFIAANASHIRAALTKNGDRTLVRSLDDVRTYSLRPVEWLIPPADHRAPSLGEIGRKYHATREGRGELFYNYLGILGLAGLLGLIASRICQRNKWNSHRFDPLLGLLWIIIFGVIGGLNYGLAAAGIDLFRASTRIGIFAQVWVCFFLGGLLSRSFRTQPRFVSVGLALVLTAAAVWDQTPPLADATARRNNIARWNTYKATTAQLERESPAGAMVFQLPSVPFPEAGRTGEMPDYEHLLPYLTSTSLRYSYGQLRTSPALRWARHLSRLPAGDLAGALERAGFSALWIDTRAYADGADALVTAFRAAGRQEIGTPGALTARVFRLNPSPNPQLPDFSDPRLQDPWDEHAASANLLALRGWYGLEQNAGKHWRWAHQEAELGVWADATTHSATLRFRLGGPPHSKVILRRGDRELWRAAPGEPVHTVKLSLSPGLNTLVWLLDGSPFRPGGDDPRELGFMVENLSMSVP